MTPRDYFASLEFHGIKLGLDSIHQLMDAAGNPQQRYPIIHVAGTNGKGSVVAFTASILRAAGYKVGRFTSPHLLDVSECFLIDGVPISNADLDDQIVFFRELAKNFANPPTYFELCTAIAFRYFAEQHVDCAVIEAGMGGRSDSTNVVEPIACAITNIDFDHQKYLGNTLEEIAFEKAGIVKTGVPVVVGDRRPERFDVIESVARERNAPLLLIGRDFTCTARGLALAPTISYRGPHIDLEERPIGLAGIHQAENAALAIALMETVADQFNVSNDAVAQGLADVRWPCRLERVMDNPPVYIDVAHNPAGIQRLAESMPSCVVVFAISSDKDVREMLKRLSPITSELIITQFEGPRATPLNELARILDNVPHAQHTSLNDAIAAGIKEASAARPLLITGSIFAAAQAREVLIANYGAPRLRF
ncbi:MAG: bifunctional folylpolyglutamate synthase/dihydrofolate synthase [Candidatus Hydrogenedentes bacterium]|nr:bifunctional folylpolyglutamate synthase/dihydrofolate synthase [Candidatus Hydrogenedentota bacterium]